MTLPDHFWAKVDKTGECWLWTAALNGGYGVFNLRHPKRVRRAHRLAWVDANGPVPEGAELDHLCRNRACVRPDHLEPVTHAENVARGAAGDSTQRLKSECPKGHPYAGDNLIVYIKPARRPGATRVNRVCRSCDRARKVTTRDRRALAPEPVA